jgi:hypothetical protein
MLPNEMVCSACGAPRAQKFASTMSNMPAPLSAPMPTYAAPSPSTYVAAGVGVTSGFAVASLVLGIVGGSILAIIFGFVALSQIKKRGQQGRGMAIAGVILGFVGTAVWIAIIAISIHVASSYRDGYNYAEANYPNTVCNWWSYGPSSDDPTYWTRGC